MQHSPIDNLITTFSKLPGLGPRSARRIVLKLIRDRTRLLEPLQQHINHVLEEACICDICHNIDTQNPCAICINDQRNPTQICVVEDVADVWAIERSNMYKGRYHILGGTLSAIDGRGPQQLGIHKLVERASAEPVREVVIATNNTVEGQTTAHYVTEALLPANVQITRLAQGIPIGGELDYLDEGTLGMAFNSRLPF